MPRPSQRIALLHCLSLGLISVPLPAQAFAELPPTRLHLIDVYQLLESRNPRLEAIRQMALAAEARVKPVSTLADPQIQFGMMNRELPGLGLQNPLGMTQVQVMQAVPIAGQLGLAGQAAEAGAGAAAARSAELFWELRARAAMAFYELYQVDRSIEVGVTTQGLLRDIGTTARTMYSVGQGRQADVLRAQVEVDRMTEELARMRAMRSAATARLNALLNQPSETPISSPLLPQFPKDLALPDSLERLALSGRPMLAAGALDVEAAAATELRARREIWPDLQLGAIYGQRPMASGTDRMVSFMLGFSVPLWAGRRQFRMRDETEAMRRAAEADLVAMRAETRGRLGEVLASIRRSRELRTLYQSSILPQALATVTSTLSSYRVGEVDLPMLLDAQMTVNRYRQQVFQLQAEEGVALAELEMLLGRALYDPALTEPVSLQGAAR